LGDSAGLTSARLLSGWPGQLGELDAAGQAISQVVANVVARNPGDASGRLATYGIGFVLVAGTELELAAAIDATPGLARVREGDQGPVVWQVMPGDLDFDGLVVTAAGRLHVVDPEGLSVALPAGDGTDLTVELEDGPDGRQLILAERAAPYWRASLDGQELTAQAGEDWYQTFELPAGGGQLRVWYQPALGFAIAQAVIVVLTVLLALPVRRRVAGREEK
jgi:hypothetical protein